MNKAVWEFLRFLPPALFFLGVLILLSLFGCVSGTEPTGWTPDPRCTYHTDVLIDQYGVMIQQTHYRICLGVRWEGWQ